jgi:dTMP kinase
MSTAFSGVKPKFRYIVFEGIDGAGKSTQMRILAERLQKLDVTAVELCEPTYGALGRKMRVALSRGAQLSIAEQTRNFTEDRRQHVRTRIRPLLALSRKGHFAILQHRFYLSAPVYQWDGDDKALALLRAEQKIAPSPDVVLLLDIPGHTALTRLKHRDTGIPGPTHLHLETLRQRYLKFAAVSGENVVKIDSRPAQDAVAKAIWRVLGSAARTGDRGRA